MLRVVKEVLLKSQTAAPEITVVILLRLKEVLLKSQTAAPEVTVVISQEYVAQLVTSPTAAMEHTAATRLPTIMGRSPKSKNHAMQREPVSMPPLIMEAF